MRKSSGFTLIEVLVAMAIIAIALIAITRNLAQATKQMDYIQDRTLAHWVAMDIIAQARIGTIAYPTAGGNTSGNETMFNKSWNWQLSSIATSQPRVLQIQVVVSDATTKITMDKATSYLLLPAVPQ